MKLRNMKYLILTVFLFLEFSACKSLKKGWDNLNLFPVSQDVELGKQVYGEIIANEKDFPKLPESGNEELYKYINAIVQKILLTGKVDYAKDFPWKITIINDPKTQNAFATPGGYIFIYTGLLKFLDSEDQLAGVLGHEIAHAANRHSTKQLTKIVGLQVLADAALGNKETIKQVATALIGLSFSRAHETQADTFSVIYLCQTDYNANGASGFFKKIKGQGSQPSWLSTHPNPANRIESIDGKQKAMGCKGNQSYEKAYAKMKALLDKINPPILPEEKTIPNTNANSTKKESKTPPPDTTVINKNKKIEKPK